MIKGDVGKFFYYSSNYLTFHSVNFLGSHTNRWLESSDDDSWLWFTSHKSLLRVRSQQSWLLNWPFSSSNVRFERRSRCRSIEMLSNHQKWDSSQSESSQIFQITGIFESISPRWTWWFELFEGIFEAKSPHICQITRITESPIPDSLTSLPLSFRPGGETTASGRRAKSEPSYR